MRTEPRVLLDATAIPAERGGVGRYVDSLAAALDAQGTALSIVCQTADAGQFASLAPHSRIVPIATELSSRPARLTWEQTTLPRLARRLPVDVIHSPHYTMPLRAGVPVVVTLHDATFFSDQQLHLGVKGRFFRGWTRTSLRLAAVCVVPSVATATELRRVVSADPQRLVVAHHGVDSERFHRPSAAEIAAAADYLKLEAKGWIAFLGTLEPRKNVPALIRAYVRAAADARDRASFPALVLAGSPGWDQAIEPALAAVPVDLQVLRAGHLPVEMLSGFLGGAALVTYPSLGEGFGLPVLEAMACGAAVLTTRRLSLPEVGGEAVAYSDVGAGDIAEALSSLLFDPTRRRELAAAAVARAAEFTWANSAQCHQEAYDRAAALGKAR
ncbi:glycosyltransferase family 4 protein [Nakamurella antarctica]|uniref:glycosyltransferase family 4 protein n=1 Tax=Nakamurella antarctica TaxID=1902245 RepID=UPI001EF09EAD|nr:glycosyltransferase family 1 protein [Nakamurella antarctica]